LRNIFISYRRDDSAYAAGRVHDRLSAEFGQDVLFMDVDAIPLGSNFVKVLEDAVGQCSVLLAVIGPNWLEAADEDGNRRLDNPIDFVRIEIGAALRRDIPVVPLLLDGAKIPKPNQLPPDLAELPVRNGLSVRGASFHADMAKLVSFLSPFSKRTDPQVLEAPVANQAEGDVLTGEIVTAEKGKWIARFKVEDGKPSVFSHHFIVIDGNDYIAPGSIVVGDMWDGTASPRWRVVHGYVVPGTNNSWHRLSSAISYLGPTWKSEFAQLSATVFKLKDGRPLKSFIEHS
jgi:hypothetical protein